MKKMEEKITDILERFCRIFKAMQWNQVKNYKLSPIQAQFLIYLCEHSKKQCSVLILSKEFSLKPSTVSDAISSLEKKGYLTKKRNIKDKRNYFLQVTKKGKNLENKMKEWNLNFIKSIQNFSLKDKEKLYDFLLSILMNLQNMGFLPDFQICLTCNNCDINETKDENHYFCKLTNKNLKFRDVKFDCNSFVRKSDFLE